MPPCILPSIIILTKNKAAITTQPMKKKIRDKNERLKLLTKRKQQPKIEEN